MPRRSLGRYLMAASLALLGLAALARPQPKEGCHAGSCPVAEQHEHIMLQHGKSHPARLATQGPSEVQKLTQQYVEGLLQLGAAGSRSAPLPGDEPQPALCTQTCGCVAKCEAPGWSTDAARNFGQNIEYEKATFSPTSVRELQRRLGRGQDKCLVPIARRHSWGQGIAPADASCEPVALDKLRGFSIDACKGTLTVEAGVLFQDVLPELQKRGLSLLNYGAIKVQTIVGAVMTSTHGSGQTPSVSNSVLELTVLPGEGASLKVLRPRVDKAAAGWLNSLGGLGFVTEMKLALVPAFNISVNSSYSLPHAEIQQLFLEQVEGSQDSLPGDYSWAIYSSEGINLFERRVVVREPSTDVYVSTYHLLDTLLKNYSQTYTEQKEAGYPIVESILAEWPTKTTRNYTVYEANLFLPATEHQSVKHVEMELFLEPADIAAFLDVFNSTLRDCQSCAYYHVYPIVMRAIMPDAMPIWMSPFQNKPRISVSFFTYLDLNSSDTPTEVLKPFTMFCDRLLTESVCNLSMDVHYHRGKYMAPAWIGALELEKDFVAGWRNFRAMRAREDPKGKIRSAYLHTYSDRMNAAYSACSARS